MTKDKYIENSIDEIRSKFGTIEKEKLPLKDYIMLVMEDVKGNQFGCYSSKDYSSNEFPCYINDPYAFIFSINKLISVISTLCRLLSMKIFINFKNCFNTNIIRQQRI